MSELAIVLRKPPSDHGPTESGICGPITHATTPALRDYLRRLLDTTTPPSPRVLLDISCCIGIDVDGLLALAVAQHAARLRGGDLHLVGAPPLIVRQIHNTTSTTCCATRPWRRRNLPRVLDLSTRRGPHGSRLLGGAARPATGQSRLLVRPWRLHARSWAGSRATLC
jgi:anti-anti-sigma regulatory factor